MQFLTQHQHIITPFSSRMSNCTQQKFSLGPNLARGGSWPPLQTTRPNFAKFSCMLTVAVARSSSDGVAIRSVLPVSWMTSCFHTMGPIWDRIKHVVMFRRVRQVAVPVGLQTTAVFGQVHQNVAPVEGEVCHLRLTCL